MAGEEKAPVTEKDEELPAMSFLDHLEDLRWCLMRAIVVFLIVLPLAIYFSGDFISFSKSLSKVSYFSALAPAEPFIQKLLVGMYLTLFITFPYLLFEVWRFISPGLYKKERKLASYMLLVSYLLFLCGAFFGLTIVIPIALDYFLSFSGQDIIYQPQLKEVISFIVKISIGMGIAAQLPILVIILYSIGVLSIETLTNNRGIVLVVILFISAFLTPPDMLSLFILGVPLYFCYELSVLLCRVMDKSIGVALDKKLSYMLILVALFLFLFFSSGIFVQIYRQEVKNFIIQSIESFSNNKKETKKNNLAISSVDERKKILKNWEEFTANQQEKLKRQIRKLWKQGHLEQKEKFSFFQLLSNWGFYTDYDKVNMQISLPLDLLEEQFQASYYVKVLVKSQDTKEFTEYLFYFGNKPQYIDYSVGENLLPPVKVKNILSYFPQIQKWVKQGRKLKFFLILRPVKAELWLRRTLYSKPFNLPSVLRIEK